MNVVFVAPYFTGNTHRALLSFLNLPGTQVALISHDPLERVPESVRGRIVGHYQVRDSLDPDQLVEAGRYFQRKLGRVDRLIGFLEQMQVPLGAARDRLGVEGMGEAVALNFREKNRMKEVLRAAGLPVARQALLKGAEDARRFIAQVGYPIVVKPPAGMGSKATMRAFDDESLMEALESLHVSPSNPAQAEEFIRGDEHTFETVSVKGVPVWSSSSYYLPGPLEVLENPWMQYCVLLPRETLPPHAQAFQATNHAALRALGIHTGLSHMEWFHLASGRAVVSEVGARPPGVHLMPLMGLAHGVDMWAKWAELMTFERFEMPERVASVGVCFFRGQGRGQTVRAVHGVEVAQAEAGVWVVEHQLPRVGQLKSDSYEGEGWAIVRSPDTQTTLGALRALVSHVQVELG